MNIEYTADISGDQVIFNLIAVNDSTIEDYTSEDGFLIMKKVSGGSDGLVGYGTLTINFDTNHLPLILCTPHYEHKQDLFDVIDRIAKNIGILNGDILP